MYRYQFKTNCNVAFCRQCFIRLNVYVEIFCKEFFADYFLALCISLLLVVTRLCNKPDLNGFVLRCVYF